MQHDLERRLAEAEETLRKITEAHHERTSYQRNITEAHAGRVEKLEKRLDAHAYRIDRHSRVMAKSEDDLKAHMDVCVKRDAGLNKKIDAVLGGIETIRSRLSLVEAKAFVDISQVVSVIGTPAPQAESDRFDKRKRDQS